MDDQPDRDLVSIIDVAQRLGVFKQTVFKAIKRLGITASKVRDSSRRNQLSSFITTEEEQRVVTELANADSEAESAVLIDSRFDDQGFFYIIQLEPKHDPGRLKLGFSISIAERLRAHRCSAPFAAVVKSWPARRVWERAAIDCVSAGSEQLHTEVFRLAQIETAVERAERFFALMPTVGDSEDAPLEPDPSGGVVT